MLDWLLNNPVGSAVVHFGRRLHDANPLAKIQGLDPATRAHVRI